MGESYYDEKMFSATLGIDYKTGKKKKNTDNLLNFNPLV